MKTIIFLELLIALCFSAKGQDVQFKQFRILSRYILPLDFEEKYELLKEEAIRKNFHVIPPRIELSKKDSLLMEKIRKSVSQENELKENQKEKSCSSCDTVSDLENWLIHSSTLILKKGQNPKQWSVAIPTAFIERLKPIAEKQFANFRYKDYFYVFALVNNQGEVLSVYFKLADCLKKYMIESELQTIYENIMKLSFNPDSYDFSQWDKKLLDDFLQASATAKKELSREERIAWMHRIENETKPCIYGLIECFRMEYENTTP